MDDHVVGFFVSGWAAGYSREPVVLTVINTVVRFCGVCVGASRPARLCVDVCWSSSFLPGHIVCRPSRKPLECRSCAIEKTLIYTCNSSDSCPILHCVLGCYLYPIRLKRRTVVHEGTSAPQVGLFADDTLPSLFYSIVLSAAASAPEIAALLRALRWKFRDVLEIETLGV